jgi:imidazolonepropionase-like amidohydrolase
MSADMIVVDDDPQKEIKAVRNIRAVMIRGRQQPCLENFSPC